MTSFSRSSHPYLARAKGGHAAVRCKDARNAEVENVFGHISRMFDRGSIRGLRVFDFARLRALRALTGLPNWVELHLLLSALVTLLQQVVRHEDDETTIARQARPRTIRPAVPARVEPRPAASF
ncbi:hypothetical protein [Deinococcus apachensis]|uniref:hypothetical protein n=1 Tax=Deinococcus apachensis TaxID=309886 RepID=UPI00037D570D|nr:hypothetical protein [Deinococcus apachensis]